MSSSDSPIELVRADITTQEVDAIVNAANSQLAHGSGVAGAISRAAGVDLQRESAAHPHVPTGSAAVTSAGELPARWVIHAVGPIFSDGRQGEPELLASAYSSALARAAELGARSIAFPSISTGVYGYPITEAAEIAVRALTRGSREHPELRLIRVCLFSESDLSVYEAALSRG